MKISTFAGQPPKPSDLVDIQKLVRAYTSEEPDPSIPSQRVQFGTSGHRGSSFDFSFNQNHILSITQAICEYRKLNNISGPLFLGMDTHALSYPALQTALEVLGANSVTVQLAPEGSFTPTPVISHAIIKYNKNRSEGIADGIVITPSHNPPGDGGFKYNPAHGGPAENPVTDWIQTRANEILEDSMGAVRRMPFGRAIKAPTTHIFDFLNPYVRDLGNVIDMEVIRDSNISIGVDPLGGAGVQYWQPIADFYKINLTVLNSSVDPTFGFMPRDWDGQIRMDPSSQYAMQSVINKSSANDISFACDTDHDRHGIVTSDSGLMPANDYLSAMVFYLFKHRPLWPHSLAIGKTVVSTQMLDRVGALLERSIVDVPVGFKWFVDGLAGESLGFAGEESAGATFLRKDASVWTTDKDAFVPCLLSAEMTARLGKDPSVLYSEITFELGNPLFLRVEAAASSAQKDKLKNISTGQILSKKLAGETIEKIITRAPGNNAPIGGIKIETKNAWLAARPSGTENIYKIYAESFLGQEHLNSLIEEGQELVNHTFQETQE